VFCHTKNRYDIPFVAIQEISNSEPYTSNEDALNMINENALNIINEVSLDNINKGFLATFEDTNLTSTIQILHIDRREYLMGLCLKH